MTASLRYCLDGSSPRARRHYFCRPLHLNAILSAWEKYVIYGSRVSRTTTGIYCVGCPRSPWRGFHERTPLREPFLLSFFFRFSTRRRRRLGNLVLLPRSSNPWKKRKNRRGGRSLASRESSCHVLADYRRRWLSTCGWTGGKLPARIIGALKNGRVIDGFCFRDEGPRQPLRPQLPLSSRVRVLANWSFRLEGEMISLPFRRNHSRLKSSYRTCLRRPLHPATVLATIC